MKKTDLSVSLRNDALISKSTCLLSITLLLLSSSLFAQNVRNSVHCEKKLRIGQDDYVYELWQSPTTINTIAPIDGDGCIEVRSNGEFSARWNMIGNTLARKAKRPGANNQSINYYIDYNYKGNVFFGAYGWWRDTNFTGTHKQAVEFYVVENYGTYNTIDQELSAVKDADGTDYVYRSNGNRYKIYVGNKTNQPSYYDRDEGIKDFVQIKSVRQNRVPNPQRQQSLQTGEILMADHFNEWAKCGHKIGTTLSEVSFKIEGYDNNSSKEGSVVKAYMNAVMGNVGTYTGERETVPTTEDVIANGTYTMKTVSGVYLSGQGGYRNSVKSRRTLDGDRTKWTFEEVPGQKGVYYIRNKQFGERLEVPNEIAIEATVVGLTSWNPAPYIKHDNLKWKAIKKSGTNNQYQFVPLHAPNLALDAWHLAKNGVVKVFYANKYNWNQLFILNAVGYSAKAEKIEVTSKEVKVFPNPASNEIKVSLAGYDLEAGSKALIYDMSGRAVLEVNALETKGAIDISSLRAGTYFIRLVIGSDSVTKSFNKM